MSAGDAEAATDRLKLLESIPVIAHTADALQLARDLSRRLQLPKRAQVDALHVAYASLASLNFLLTWNCTHIANAHLWSMMKEVVELHGLQLPTICTPWELMGEEYHDESKLS